MLEKIYSNAMLTFFRRKRIILVPTVPKMGNIFDGLASKICQFDKNSIFVGINYRLNLLKCVCYNCFFLLASLLNKSQIKYYVLSIDHLNMPIQYDEKDLLNRITQGVLQSIFNYNGNFLGVSFFDLVEYKTKCSFIHYLKNMLLDSNNLKFGMNKLKKQLVMSYSARNLKSVAGELTKGSGKSSLFLSHGAHHVAVDEAHEIELYNLCKGFMLGTYTHVA